MNTLFLFITLIIAIPIIIFMLEVIFALFPQKKIMNLDIENRPTITVLVPAHNESEVIINTLESIKKQLIKNDRLVVVADNCTDNTSRIAKMHGAEVIERNVLNQRGKGYALDFGIRHIEKDPTQVVIIIDADCFVENETLEILSKIAVLKNRPVQALYMMNYINPSIKQRIAEFAWLVKNYVRPRGLYNIGMPCQLMGTGMAFPWEIIVNTKLASGNIVEDMKMGLDMAKASYAPLFYPYAKVTSTFPETTSAEQSQKKRWEHGHLSILISVIPRFILHALKQRSINVFVMSLDLIVPPLALLALLVTIVFSGSLIFAILTESYLPLIFSSLLIILFTFTVFLSWFLWGRRVVSLLDLLKVPIYVLGKIPLYVTYLFKRQKEWIRTDRD
ncbi:MAG: glycosyltransferase family 2 protein [Pseudomonadota bacterium]